MKYFILRNDEQEGPYPLGKLLHFRKTGAIDDSTLVWVESLPTWIQFKALGNYIQLKAEQDKKTPKKEGPATPEDYFKDSFKISDEPLPIERSRADYWTPERTCFALIVLSLILSIAAVFILPEILFVFISLILFTGAVILLACFKNIKEKDYGIALGWLGATVIPVIVLLISLFIQGDPDRPKDPQLAKIYDLEKRASAMSAYAFGGEADAQASLDSAIKSMKRGDDDAARYTLESSTKRIEDREKKGNEYYKLLDQIQNLKDEYARTHNNQNP